MVLIGGVIMFYIIVGILQRPADVPHPSATTSRPDFGVLDQALVDTASDQGVMGGAMDATTGQPDMLALPVLVSPARPVDAAVPAPVDAAEPPSPAVELAAPPVAPKVKKARKRRVKSTTKPRRQRRVRPRRAPQPKQTQAVDSDPYERL